MGQVVYPELQSAEELQRLYDEHGSMRNVAEHLGCSLDTVSKYIRRHDIETTTLNHGDVTSVSDELREIIIAGILGDGNTFALSKGRSAYQFQNTCEEYVNHIGEKLSDEGIYFNWRVFDNREGRKDLYRLETQKFMAIGELRKKFYLSNGDRRIPNNFQITPRIARYWFADDGVTSSNSRWGYGIAIQDADERELEVIESELERKTGIRAFRAEWGFRFNKEDTRKFFHYTGAPPCGGTIAQKWPKEYR
jgi:predicted transcriptional regulator